MVTKVLMPRLSLTMKEGTVGKWYKHEGDTVQKNEPVVEIVSEKATYDLEAPASGILKKILAREGLDVPVDTVIAIIGSEDESIQDITAVLESQIETPEKEPRTPASPAAKRLAKEHGINLSTLKIGGTRERITEEDVRKTLSQQQENLPRVKETVPLSGLRKISAERVAMSFRTVPHSTIMMEADATDLIRLHERTKASYTAIIVKSVAHVLTEEPWINSSLEDGQVKIFENINVGVAVATGNGLVVPVVHDAGRKSLMDIEGEIGEMTDMARKEKLSRKQVSGGTFTVTNLGMYGVDFFTPIINPPEAAILGVGRMTEKPVVFNGRIEVRTTIMLSLSYDHRIVDGGPAARFLGKVKTTVENVSKFLD